MRAFLIPFDPNKKCTLGLRRAQKSLTLHISALTRRLKSPVWLLTSTWRCGPQRQVLVLDGEARQSRAIQKTSNCLDKAVEKLTGGALPACFPSESRWPELGLNLAVGTLQCESAGTGKI